MVFEGDFIIMENVSTPSSVVSDVSSLVDAVSPPVMESVGTPAPDARPLMSTNFVDYTVTEGLLLLIFLSLVVGLLIKLIRGVF